MTSTMNNTMASPEGPEQLSLFDADDYLVTPPVNPFAGYTGEQLSLFDADDYLVTSPVAPPATSGPRRLIIASSRPPARQIVARSTFSIELLAS